MDENEIREQIPEPIYKDLIELYGKDKTIEILNSKRTDFRGLTMRIMAEKFKRRFGISFWIVFAIGFAIWLIYVFFIQL